MVDPKSFCRRWVDDHKDLLIELSKKIWNYAELGFLERKSSALIASMLKKHGFNVKRGVAGMPTAIIATWGKGGPTIGIMGEYDALPGLSQKTVPHKEPREQGAPGHGCGHNIHGTSGLGGALALKYAMEEADLSGTIKFFGTPAEESGGGKVWMVKAGIFEGVDAVLSHHPSSMNTASLRSSNALNSVKFHFHGKSSHAGGSPEQGQSALDAVELMNVGVNYMREHMIQDARIHYVIEEGGNAPNIVPDYARVWYFIRAPEREQVDELHERVVNIAKGATFMTGTELEVDVLEGLYNVIPNKPLSEIVLRNMREIGPPEYSTEERTFGENIAGKISTVEKREALRKSKRRDWEELMDVLLDRSIPDPWDEGEVSHGSTDVADVSWQAPTLEFSTTAWVLGTPGHSWMNVAHAGMGIGHKSLLFAAKVIATSAIDLLTTPDLREKAWEEFKERTKGKEYTFPLPEGAEPPLDVNKSSLPS
ncbi:MAG: amidohydrolase [Candidatus Korarchaeota archaeon]|nr:amidohydrolase [Candidatus Korarchaeota archaeon]NIU81911.1 amidohydrolase [Candidatus Thorarchaeota archaeon]NIW12369.1 amidohydrolase [Candidatus Thorarchaeota archaeon]NIW51161.1 amidohydrolase [Candidatus Korarchaeota archaeon]